MNNQASLGDVPSSDSAEKEIENSSEAPELISGVAWSKIEGFPKDWEANELGGDVDLQTGNNFPSENFVDEGGLPLIRIRDLPTGDPETNYKGEYDEQHVIEPQDLLVGMDGEFRPYLWKGDKALLNQRVLKIESEKYNKFFLRYALDKPLRYIQKSIAGTTVKHLSQKNVKKINLPTAETDEQRRIASVLYNVDQAISKTEEIIEQTQRVKKGLMQDLVLQGIDNSNFDEYEIGPKMFQIPTHWDVVPLRNIQDEDKDNSFTDGDWVESSNMVENGDYQLIQLGNIGEGEFKGECNRYISEEFFQKEDCTEVEPGDLLISRMAEPIMRTTVCPASNTKSITAVDIVVAKVDENNWDRRYLKYLLNYKQYTDIGRAYAAGSTRKRISRENLEAIQIPKPKKKKQTEIADIIESSEIKVRNLKEQKEQLERLKKGLMQDLLTGSVRTGEDVRVLDEVVV